MQLCSAQTRNEPWHLVICGGILQDAQASQAEARVIGGLSRFFTDNLGIDRDAVDVVCDEQSLAFGPNTTACTRKSLEKTLAKIVSNTRNIEKFVFYYTGQANRAVSTLRLNVRGEDIIHDELVRWLGAVKAKQRLIVLDCPCAGLAIEDLADPNTIVICSARGDQYDSPRFSEYFVPALLQWESDKDTDGRLSLLEAFQTTSQELDAYYEQEKCYKSENALLEDDGDGVPSQQPWLFATSRKDGARAAQFYFRQILVGAPSQGQ
ncbi:MAG TPA: hypothetical protein DIU00_21255 [Phycisphaerales bacterium]|nr:hypothetical protein [Phycisphaerales bacterium]